MQPLTTGEAQELLVKCDVPRRLGSALRAQRGPLPATLLGQYLKLAFGVNKRSNLAFSTSPLAASRTQHATCAILCTLVAIVASWSHKWYTMILTREARKTEIHPEA